MHSHAGPGMATTALAARKPLLAQGITTSSPPEAAVPSICRSTCGSREPMGLNVALMVPHGLGASGRSSA